MDNVFTYYESGILDGQQPLLECWRESWSRHGWTPIVLGRGSAQAHPEYESYVAAVDKLPTVNPREYERACYLRHLAMEWMGGGLLVDYDVVNRGLTPDGLPERSAIGHVDGNPCVTWGRDEGIFEAIRRACEGADTTAPHMSDMFVVMGSMGLLIEPLCSEWGDTPLVHVSNDVARQVGRDKLELMYEKSK